jgi:hypothetical protein
MGPTRRGPGGDTTQGLGKNTDQRGRHPHGTRGVRCYSISAYPRSLWPEWYWRQWVRDAECDYCGRRRSW